MGSQDFDRRWSLVRVLSWFTIATLSLPACENSPPAPSEEIKVTIAKPVIEITESTEATASPSVGSSSLGSIGWNSSNPAVARIELLTGRIVGVSDGTTTITANAMSFKTGTATLEVRTPVNAVVVNAAQAAFAEQSQVTVTAVAQGSLQQVVPNKVATFALNNANATLLQTGPTTALVTGALAGTAQVSATMDGKIGQTTLTITPEPVATVSVVVSPASVTVGGTATVTGSTLGANARVLTGRTVSFQSSNLAVATVAQHATNPNSATITGVSPGQTTITFSSEGKSSTALVTVTPKVAAQVTLTLSSTQLAVNATATATATVLASDNTVIVGAPVTFGANNSNVVITPSPVTPNIATVSARAIGPVRITATSGTASANLDLLIVSQNPPPTIASIRVPFIVVANQTVPATAFGALGDDISGNVQWSTSDATIATIDGQGFVTGKVPGTVDVQAQSGLSAPLKSSITVFSAPNVVFTYIDPSAFSTYGISGGGLWAWGRNTSGQLGQGFSSPSVVKPTQIPVAGNPIFVEVSGGLEHFVALTDNGDVYTGGYGFDGALCNSSRANSTVPYKVTGLPGAATWVEAGPYNTIIGMANGNVYGCGDNASGQLGAAFGVRELAPVLIYNGSSPAIDGGVGDKFIHLLTQSAQASQWIMQGNNNRGQAGNGTQTNVNNWFATAIPDAWHASLKGYYANGNVRREGRAALSTGWQSRCLTLLPTSLSGADELTSLCTGDNQLGDISDQNVPLHTTPVVRDYRITNVRLNARNVTAVRQSFTNVMYSTATATSGSTGNVRRSPTSALAAATEGPAFGRGFNFFSQLANGAFSNAGSWDPVAGGYPFKMITASPTAYHTCGLTKNGEAFCWGRNEDGQTGQPLSVRAAPAPVNK